MTLDFHEQVSRIRLARSQSIGPVTYRKLIKEHRSAAAALDFLLDGKHAKKVANVSVAEREIETANKLGCQTLFLDDGVTKSPYPTLLAATDDAPPLMHTLGDTGLMHHPCLGVVGSRSASAAGIKLTNLLVSELAKTGLVIVSGMARGIDAAAHKAAIQNGTVACLAGGVDSIYPPQNQDLYHSIQDQGLIVSEVPPGTQATARHFPRRNRIVSGLSLGVLVIEATSRSGSLITARLAGEQGREVFAVPGSPLDPRAEGANRLLKDGAVLVRNTDDILTELATLINNHQNQPPTARPTPIVAKQPPEKDTSRPSERQPTSTTKIEDLMATTPVHIDELVRQSAMTTEAVLQELQLLELDGKIQRHTGGKYSKVS